MSAQPAKSNMELRLGVLAVAAIEMLFWLYTFAYINNHANPLGDGLEWLAAVPMTIIFLVLTAPAMFLAGIGLWLKFAAILATIAAVADVDVYVWIEILGEFAHKGAC